MSPQVTWVVLKLLIIIAISCFKSIINFLFSMKKTIFTVITKEFTIVIIICLHLLIVFTANYFTI